jgi:molecular chaperone DnaK
VHTALQGANLAVADIDDVLLVGGATRTPLIQTRLAEVLGMPPRAEVDPDLCVAAGAAIQAAVIGGVTTAGVLVDVTPYTFGTSAVGEVHGMLTSNKFVPLIRKNTPIPVTKSDAFETMYDGQESVDVKIYQGEHPDALQNTQIGSFRVEGLSDVPAGNVIVMRFELDLNGILKVTAEEKRTGLAKHIAIDNAMARFEAEELDAARKRLNTLIDGDADATADGARPPTDGTDERREAVQAEALVEKAERLLDTVGADDREDLVNLIESVRDALSAGDIAALEPAMAELSDLIYYLET